MARLQFWRGVSRFCVCLALALSCWGGGLRAQQDDRHKALAAEIGSLQRAGKYADALPLAERLIAMAKARHGEGSAEHADALEMLSANYFYQSLNAEAEPIYKRVLAIREKVLGPAHESVLSTIDLLASLYLLSNQPQLAEPLLRRALAAREGLWGAGDPRLAGTLGDLAQALTALKRYVEAEALLRRAIGLAENGSKDGAQTAKLLGALAQIERAQGRLGEAAFALRRGLALLDEVIKKNPSDRAGQMTRVLTLMQLCNLYQDLNRHDDAGKLAEEALGVLEKLLGPDHPDVASALQAVAIMRGLQGRDAEGETLLKRAIAINERVYGNEHLKVARSLRSLGHHYRAQDRLDEALPLLSRAMTLAEKSLGPEHPALAPFLVELGDLHKTLKRYDQAELFYKRALANLARPQGADAIVSGDQTIDVLTHLAFLNQARGRHEEARPFIERALAASERTFGPDHGMTGAIAGSLAALLIEQDRVDEAERLLDRALPIMAKLGRENSPYASTIAGLGMVHFKRKDWVKAYAAMKEASDIFIVADQRSSTGAAVATVEAGRQRTQHAVWFLLQALAAYQVAKRDATSADALRDEAFQVAQRAHNSQAAAALGQMAARFSSAGDALGALVRERQDLANEWRAADARLTTAFSAPSTERSETNETALRARLGEIASRLDAIGVRFAKEFPEYATLANPQPLSIAAAQEFLGADEALVFIATRSNESLVWVIGKDGARWTKVPLGEEAVAREAAALRCGLDSAAWVGGGAANCQALLGRTLVGGRPLPFDLARAHALYDALFSPFEDLIEGKRLLIAASGPLATLPFAALVTETPGAAIPVDPSDYAAASWLAKRHAVTTLPSLASLRSLRSAAKESAAKNPFIGFGNPLIGGQDGKDRSAWAKESCPKETKARPPRVAGRAVPDDAATLFRGKLANADALRRQEPLPETADELCTVARGLGAGERDVALGAKATETTVKTLSGNGALASYKVVHFATHGLVAGETELFGSGAEPSLLLTPPETPSDEDDGLLTASEVAQLELDADWVVLSACNTAAGAKGGGEALSGLARAFFYSGARALLVSHWYVDSDAAVKLVTAAFAELRRDPAIGRAEALRRAMLAVMADNSRPATWPRAAHPAVWAPFVVVGEGGAAR